MEKIIHFKAQRTGLLLFVHLRFEKKISAFSPMRKTKKYQITHLGFIARYILIFTRNLYKNKHFICKKKKKKREKLTNKDISSDSWHSFLFPGLTSGVFSLLSFSALSHQTCSLFFLCDGARTDLVTVPVAFKTGSQDQLILGNRPSGLIWQHQLG